MPAHRTSIAAAVLGLAALATLAATGIGVANAQSNSSAATSAMSNTAAVTSSSRGCLPDYSPIPATWSTEMGGLDIGRLTKVTAKDGVVTVRIDRVSFFTGAEAKALNHGKVPLDDYILTNIGRTQRTFTVDPKSSILADSALLTNPDGAGTPAQADPQAVRGQRESPGQQAEPAPGLAAPHERDERYRHRHLRAVHPLTHSRGC